MTEWGYLGKRKYHLLAGDVAAYDKRELDVWEDHAWVVLQEVVNGVEADCSVFDDNCVFVCGWVGGGFHFEGFG